MRVDTPRTLPGLGNLLSDAPEKLGQRLYPENRGTAPAVEISVDVVGTSS